MARSSLCPKCCGYVRYEVTRAVCVACGWQIDDPMATERQERLQYRIDRSFKDSTSRVGTI